MGQPDPEDERFKRWVLEHTRRECLACGGIAWITENHSVYAPYRTPGVEGIGPDFIPFVCAMCGYTRLHSVMVLEKVVPH